MVVPKIDESVAGRAQERSLRREIELYQAKTVGLGCGTVSDWSHFRIAALGPESELTRWLVYRTRFLPVGWPLSVSHLEWEVGSASAMRPCWPDGAEVTDVASYPLTWSWRMAPARTTTSAKVRQGAAGGCLGQDNLHETLDPRECVSFDCMRSKAGLRASREKSEGSW